MLSSFVKALPQLLIIIALSFCGPALAERELASQPETREIHRLLNTTKRERLWKRPRATLKLTMLQQKRITGSAQFLETSPVRRVFFRLPA